MLSRRAVSIFLWVTSLLAICPVHAGSPAQEIYSFGVAPQQSPAKLASVWGPILKEISRETGVTLQFKTAVSVEVFEQRLAKGQYDIAYMNPYHYVEFHQTLGYEPLVRARDRELRGILVARRDSSYRTLAELSGETLAFPAPTAFAASVLVRAEFARQHIPITPKYVSSHDSVYLDVAKGLFPAGGGIMRTFNTLNPHIRDQLKIIYETQAYTPHAIAALPRVPSDVAARLQAAFVSLDQASQGRELLAPLTIKGWVAAQDTDWDDVRALCKILSIKSFGQ